MSQTNNNIFPWRLYLAHSLSSWGDNMWWFAGGLYMMELAKTVEVGDNDNGNLRLTAIYGLVIASVVMLFGASIGRWIDNTKRINAARIFLAIQNLSVAICSVILSFFLWKIFDMNGYFIAVVVIVLSAVSRLASEGTKIVLHKDWIVVIADNDVDLLAKMNSVMKTIELTTYMLAPAMTGQLFTFIGYEWTGLFIAGWNCLSVIFEYILLELIYRAYPGLASRGTEESSDESIAVPDGTVPSSDDDLPIDNDESVCCYAWSDIRGAYDGWKVYFNHPVRNAGIGLALLYMTVLGFDNITYGYVLMQRVPEYTLGVLVGISALVGVLGSLAYPQMRKHFGLERTGLMGMFLLVSTSSMSVVSIFLPGSPFLGKFRSLMNAIMPQIKSSSEVQQPETLALSEETVEDIWQDYGSVSVLLIGIIVARFGLWIVDLTITQILQENVEEERRGVVNGVQEALNNSLDLLKCILVILLPEAENFGFLIILSFLSISTGWLSYALYSRQKRGHLFHFCRLVQVIHPHDLGRRSSLQKEDAEAREACYKVSTISKSVEIV